MADRRIIDTRTVGKTLAHAVGPAAVTAALNPPARASEPASTVPSEKVSGAPPMAKTGLPAVTAASNRGANRLERTDPTLPKVASQSAASPTSRPLLMG